MIRAQAVEKRYGRRQALRPLDLELDQGGFLVVPEHRRLQEDDAPAPRRGPGGAERRASPCRRRPRRALGYLGHEPLLYRDLTALENLDLYGRLCRVRERRERTGICSNATASGTSAASGWRRTRAG